MGCDQCERGRGLACDESGLKWQVGRGPQRTFSQIKVQTWMRARADKDKTEIQHQTELQERALDGIDAALGDLEVMSKVRPAACALPTVQLLADAAIRLLSPDPVTMSGLARSVATKCTLALVLAGPMWFVRTVLQHMGVELDGQNRRVDAVGAKTENTHDEIR